ncbi:MAG: hypothetical protein KJZ78_28290, partial [Bryobacteraceae bacterium]|nr:hypothetical protein [Bryobacteraceae bacterium]
MNRFLLAALRTGFVVVLTLSVIDSLSAAEKRPNGPRQILGGKPALSNGGSARFYNGQGAYAGRTSASGSTIRAYSQNGSYAG